MGPKAGRYRLVLLRHGQSEWNAANLFTGWVNVELTPEGEREAAGAGRLLADRGLRPDVVHTSLQRRAIRTADLALAACDRDWIAARRTWRLNSNHYGSLQGRNKAEVALRDGTARLLPYWYDAIVGDLRTGACVLVVPHGNTLRALIRHLDRMSEDDGRHAERRDGRAQRLPAG